MKTTRGKKHTHQTKTAAERNEEALFQKVRTYINTEWRTHATAAWDNYQQFGRGFILLEGIPPKKMGYCAQQLPQQADTFATFSTAIQELAQLIDTYDPTKQVIFVVLLPINQQLHIHFAAYAENPPPPEAWVAFKDFKERKHAKP